jgi:DNA-binding transcriptional regulator LsrR (DeoR family)
MPRTERIVSAGLKRSLADEDGIGATLGLWDEATAALVGIGAWPKHDPTLVAAGFSASDPAIEDATGDVVGRFFAEDGTLIHYTDEPQLITISADQLRLVPNVIGIAAGIDKAKAVVGAARAGLISTLVTDTVTARAIAPLLD